MSARTHRLVLAIVRTDRTFERAISRGREVWTGKCIHCQRHLDVGLDGRPVSKATIEHIRPRCHGGTDELMNVALACRGCNNEKGVRHDARKKDDPKLEQIIARLSERRRARWRDDPEAASLAAGDDEERPGED